MKTRDKILLELEENLPFMLETLRKEKKLTKFLDNLVSNYKYKVSKVYLTTHNSKKGVAIIESWIKLQTNFSFMFLRK